MRPIQILIGPNDLDPKADDRLHRRGEPAAGQGQADDAAQRMSQHDGAGIGLDDTGDRGGEVVEGVPRSRPRAAMTGQVRRYPAPRPPPSEQGPPPIPYVAGRAEAV